MVYRTPTENASVLHERIGYAARLEDFMGELRELSATSRIEVDIVFQCLLQGVAESTGMMISGKGGFDSQAGTFKAFGAADFVPMHQAKVLDRSERLKEEEASIRAIAADRLDWLVASADLLRKLLRVKVEDGNDLQMAMSTVEQVHRFYSRMQQYAEQSGEEPFSLYQRLVTF